MSDRSRVDVAVIGGGPAGAAAALASAREGCAVVLVERGDGRRRSLGESLPPVGGRLLRAVFGAGRPLLTSPPHEESYGHRSVWGDDVAVSTDFVLDPEGKGWHLDRAQFDASLRDAARAEGAGLRTGTEFKVLRRLDARWALDVVSARGPSVVEATVVVDATGRPAVVARAAGAHRRRADRLVAAVALLDRFDVDATTLVEAVEFGWWYTAPVPNGRRAVGFVTDGDLLDARGCRSHDGWLGALGGTRHVSEAVGAAGRGLHAMPTLVAADTGWLEPVLGENVLAVGDAALSFDPLSSLGILSAVDFGAAGGAAAAALVRGDRSAAAAYATRLANHRRGYLTERERVYGTEHRWLASPFWRRRTQRPPHPLREAPSRAIGRSR